MQFLSEKQKAFLIKKEIKAGQAYSFPSFGFNVYEKPSYASDQNYLDTNPFTKSLEGELCDVKGITDGFCRVNFTRRPQSPDFYMRIEELQYRNIFEVCVLFVITIIPFLIYNLFTRKNEAVQVHSEIQERV